MTNISILGPPGIWEKPGDGKTRGKTRSEKPGDKNPVTDRTYPMNPSEDLLSLGGNQLLFLCSRSPIFAVAKASRHAAVRHRSHWPARPSTATPEGTNTPGN
jgi:hypothetical protein